MINYNPDVISCLANLSSDEIFTPPSIANNMLDLLPEEIWHDRNATFLDPACKTGVFLREIAKRLMAGLSEEIPDVQERANHIFKHQLFGIAITELTSLISRRSVYCSKQANGKYSVCTKFDNSDGNICFNPELRHTWGDDGKCTFCKASKSKYDRGPEFESHAYQFIHSKDIAKQYKKMKFDVIIGNPPYHLDDEGNNASAVPLYHLFIENAINLNPKYICMIVPARWYAGGKGLNNFRQMILQDKRIREIHDFVNGADCFPSVSIKGGVCYFLWDRDYKGDCIFSSHEGNKIVSTLKRPLAEPGQKTLIRYNEAIPIFHKVKALNEKTMDTIVSSRKPFGFATNFEGFSLEEIDDSALIYAQKKKGYIKHSAIREEYKKLLDSYKLFIPEAIGSGNMSTDLVKPILGEPNTCCTETYVLCGPFDSKECAMNAMSYIKTKFFHFMLGLRKITHHTTSEIYEFVPLQDFTRPWNDKDLYEKYHLNAVEQDTIERMVHQMED